MRSLKKVNVGVIVALVLLFGVIVYIAAATAVNNADEDEIRSFLTGFCKELGKADVAAVKDVSKMNVAGYDAALRERFYTENCDSDAALSRHNDETVWDSLDESKTDVTVQFDSFRKAEVSASFYDKSYNEIAEMTFTLVKVNGEWRIDYWKYGKDYNGSIIDLF